MRNFSTHTGMLVWATLLACCLQISLTLALSDESPINSKSEEESQRMDSELPKRDWNKNLKMWGKRGWNNLHGGWGLKRAAPSWADQLYSPPIVEKRAWQNLQSGWGKRMSPDDEYTIQKLASMLEDNIEPQYSEFTGDNDFMINDDDKRNWRQFNDGWGKRNNKWDKFRGAWGKRDPAWSNLKGIWGKRSVQDQIAE